MRYWRHAALELSNWKFEKEYIGMSKCIMVVDDDLMNLKMADFIL